MKTTLLQGNCLELMKDIEDQSIDMILCDLPFGTTACKWDSVIPFEPLWEQYKRIVKQNSAIVLFGSQPFTSLLVGSNLKMFKYEWVWEKSRGSNFVHCHYQPLKTHENVIVFSLGGAGQGSKNPMSYFPQMKKGKPYNKGIGHKNYDHLSGGNTQRKTRSLSNKTGDRFPRSVVYSSSDCPERGLHPTQKPVSLLEYLIKTYTLENNVVLDNCMGSGSTGVACINTNRQFIGIEQDKKYFDVAKKRIENAIITR